ncbi:hypothetical protein [Variovorax soli]|uniref:PXPV repeat-containing protein n=1 Tax=Variovorax soli TaxID=376815 RepID=A0ABU1NKJ0_9BURK|nr:hypothetical protein [Variovorax soli]MDR6538962.1 hypothetical protein [Variovorax soli]
MNLRRSVFLKWTAVTLAATGALFAAASANAGTSWSLGINVPGVAVGIADPGPVYYQPAPVYSQPAPVYYEPAPPAYYRPAPVYTPAPVYYGPPAAYYEPPGERWRHHRHQGRDWGDRDD